MTESNGIVVTTIPSVDPHRQPNSGPYNVTFTIENTTKNGLAMSVYCTTSGPMTCANVSWGGGVLSGRSSVNVSLTYTTTSGSGLGGVTLVAELDIGTPPTSWATRSVTVVPPGKGVIQPMVAGENLDRGLCLTTGAGEGGGLSCGDLFLVEGMPAYRTLGKDRSLALHYNSATATGLTLVPAWIREPASIATPSSVQVILTVGSQADTTAYSLPSVQQCNYTGCADSMQVVVGRNLNWAAVPTGQHQATLTLRNIYPSSIKDTVVTFPLLVVNRSTSEYGRGWSLLGIEQLFDMSHATLRTWTAGDGSARVYRRGVGLSSGMLSQSGLTTFSAIGATDGSIGSTGWTTDASSAGAWVRVDLGTAQTVTTLGINAEPGTSNAVYNVQYSDNASTWKTAFTGLRPIGGAWRQVTWASVGSHRYWRLYLTNAPGSGSPIAELSFGGVNVFYGAPGDAPDSLVQYTDSMTWYRRDLKHGASVTFDAAGRHRFTTNRTGQRTTMTWTTVAGQPRLGSITVPPNDPTGRNYLLSWDATTARLNYIQDPGGRQLTTVMSGDKLGKIRAPGGLDSTRFAYDARGVLNKRIVTSQHLSTRGDSATTTYSYGNNARVTQVSIQADSAGTAFATTTVLPWDEKGLTTPLVLDTLGLATRINGPITGNGDVVDIWVDRFGQPRRITQVATNTVTRIWRDSTQTLPALITRIDYPHPTTGGAAGRTARLAWNARGNLVSQRDSTSHLGTIGLPTKGVAYTYGDAANPDSPTQVIDALERTVTYTYNALGLTASVLDQRAHTSTYSYVTSGALTGMLSEIVEQNVPTWNGSTSSATHLSRQFSYDANGNLKTDDLPTGVRYLYVSDGFGRVTDVYDPVRSRTSRVYDALNRVTSLVQYTTAQAVPGGLDLLAGCDTVQVSCVDSTEPNSPGIPSTLTTTFFHGAGGVDSVLDQRGVPRRYRYGARGEVRSEIDEAGLAKRPFIGVGGTLDSLLLRSGVAVRFSYDSLGRRTQMAYPSVSYGEPVPVYGDTIVYTYDRTGQLLSADNGGSAVVRTYFADGSPRTEVNTNTQYDSLAFGYDAAGARTRMVYRGIQGATDSVRYFYGGTTGDLDSMLVRWGTATTQYQAARRFTFTWDALGRRQQVRYPAAADNMTVDYVYDASGALRRLLPQHAYEPSGGTDVFDFSLENEVIDPVGRILKQRMECDHDSGFLGNPCGDHDILVTDNQYNRMGWLVRQQAGLDVDLMRYDASGNMRWRSQNGYPGDSFYVAPARNRMTRTVRGGGGVIDIGYDGNGSRRSEVSSPFSSSDRVYFYDGLGRTSGLRIWTQLDGGTAQWHGNPNSCRYDPLGRQTIACASGAPALGFDGDNIVRAGNWSVAQGPGLDDPLVAFLHGPSNIESELYYITDGAGRHYATANGNGVLPTDVPTHWTYDGWRATGGTSASSTFSADRLEEPGAPELSFFRNRVYDQSSGRWTQEDPIGLSGGINLYQFNGNNPVAFTDPFGLCPIEETGVPCTLTKAGAGLVAGAASGVLVGGSVGSIVPGAGTLAGAGSGAVTGGTAGLVAGAIVGAVQDGVSLLEMSGLGKKISRGIHRTIETLGFIVGMLANEPPPKKPDSDDHKPPPPAPTSTKGVTGDQEDDH